MSRPRLLDLFCGAGGASVGYYRAGFNVTGVDIAPQPRYAGDVMAAEFVMDDALEILDGRGKYLDLRRFDAIHASPPCQSYSGMSNCRPGLADDYAALVDVVRERLIAIGKPWVIENVKGAPLAKATDLFGSHGVELCGQMFSLPLYRHRTFETSFGIATPYHPPHTIPASKAGHWKPGTIISVAGNCYPIKLAREAMGIDWMRRDELAEAIPPAFTKHIGTHLMKHLREAA